MLDLTEATTDTGRALVLVDVDRPTFLAASASHRHGDAVWAFGKESSEADTRERLTNMRPTEKLRELYEKARERMDEALADTYSQASSQRRRKVRSEDGGELDVSRYIDGREDYWWAMQADSRPHRIVRLGFDVCVAGMTTHEEIAKSAALCAATVDALKAGGISSEVVLFYGVPNGFDGPLSKMLQKGTSEGYGREGRG